MLTDFCFLCLLLLISRTECSTEIPLLQMLDEDEKLNITFYATSAILRLYNYNCLKPEMKQEQNTVQSIGFK